MKEDMLQEAIARERVRSGLAEAITNLCKDGLNFSSEMCVEGLLGITLDNKDVFLVNIKEVVKGNYVNHGTNSIDPGIYMESTEIAAYDKPLDFSSKVRSFVGIPSQESRGIRASRKRKPKHISETIILDNEDEEVLVRGPPCNSSLSVQQSAAVDFSKPPQVPTHLEANSACSSPIPSRVPSQISAAPSPPSSLSGTSTTTAINSSIPQALNDPVSPTTKKPKLIQSPIRSQLVDRQGKKHSDPAPVNNTQKTSVVQGKTFKDKIGNLIQNAVDHAVERVHSNLIGSDCKQVVTNTNQLQSALDTAVRSAHHANATDRSGEDRSPSPGEEDRLVIVESSGDKTCSDTQHSNGPKSVVKDEPSDDNLSNSSSSSNLPPVAPEITTKSGAQFIAPNAIINPSLLVPALQAQSVFPGPDSTASSLLQLTQHPLSALQV